MVGDIYRQIDRPLPDAVRAQIFHLRNKFKGDGAMEFWWQDVDGSTFGHSDACPIEPNKGASDCTVPYWSAILADTADDHVYPLNTKTKHGDLAEDDTVLMIVKKLSDGDGLPGPGDLPDQSPVPGAPVTDVENLAHDIRSGTVNETELMSKPRDLIREFFNHLAVCA